MWGKTCSRQKGQSPMQPSQVKRAFICEKGLTCLGESKCFYMEKSCMARLEGGSYTFLGNRACPPTPPLSQHFALSEKQVSMLDQAGGGVGGQFPRQASYSCANLRSGVFFPRADEARDIKGQQGEGMISGYPCAEPTFCFFCKRIVTFCQEMYEKLAHTGQIGPWVTLLRGKTFFRSRCTKVFSLFCFAHKWTVYSYPVL